MNAVQFDDVGRRFTCEPAPSPGDSRSAIVVGSRFQANRIVMPRSASSRRESPLTTQRLRIAVPGLDLEKRTNEGWSRRSHQSQRATASRRPGEAPSSEPVEDDARSELPRRTPPHDQNQRRRAEKTTVRPLSDPRGIENDE